MYTLLLEHRNLEPELLTCTEFYSKYQIVSKLLSFPLSLQQKMMVAFESGRCTEFFRIWNQYVPDDFQENDQICQKLHFNINIYFAIYPITHGNQVLCQLS